MNRNINIIITIALITLILINFGLLVNSKQGVIESQRNLIETQEYVISEQIMYINELHEIIDGNDNAYSGSVFNIDSEIYAQDWILVFDNGYTFEKDDVKLIEEDQTNSTVSIQFPYYVVTPTKGHLYYEKNVDAVWFNVSYDVRRAIVWDVFEDNETLMWVPEDQLNNDDE